MKKKLKSILPLLILSLILVLPYLVFAQSAATTDPLTRLDNVAKGPNGPYTQGDLPTIVGLVINGVLSLLGVIFIILTVTAGIKWMTAAGSQDKVKAATDSIQRSVIGLIIVASSWAIWNFIVKYLIRNI
jgi:hypothetical protein